MSDDEMRLGYQPTYVCYRHGNVEGAGMWRFSFPDLNIQRDYCILCVMAMFDEFCQQLTEKKDDRS